MTIAKGTLSLRPILSSFVFRGVWGGFGLDVSPRIILSGFTISEGAALGTIIGSLSVANGTGPYTFRIAPNGDPSGLFEVVGDTLRNSGALNFEAAQSHTITLEADNGSDDPTTRIAVVSVTNEFEGVPFNTLTLSVDTIIQGIETTIDILGTTPGSVLSGTVPAGMTLNSAERTITGTPTVIGDGVTLTESGLDSEPVVSTPTFEVVIPEPLNLLALPAQVSPNTTVVILGRTPGSTLEPVVTPPGWVLDPVAGEFDIGAGAALGNQNWSVKEISSNPFVAERVSSGTTEVDDSGPPLDFIGYGQSNFVFWATRSDSGTPAPHPDTMVWNPDTDAWETPVGEGVIQFLNAMQAATGRMCRLVWGGVSGVPINRLQKGHPDGNYERLLADIQASGIDPSFIIWHQGEGDAAGTAPTAGVYPVDLNTLHTDLAADTGKTLAELPIVLSSLATTTAPSVATDEAWQTIQNDLVNVNTSYPNIHFSHSNLTAVRLDTFHWNAASYGRSGLLSAQTVLTLMGLRTVRPNWTLDEAGERISTTRTRITLVHSLGNDFSPSIGITGFEVSNDFGDTWEPAVGTRQGGSTIDLDHIDLGTGTRLVRYQYGRNPDVSGAVRDNSSLTVPLQFTVATILVPGLAAAPVLTHQNSFEVGGGVVHSGSIPFVGVSEESLCVVSGQHRGNADLTDLSITAQPSGTALTPILVGEEPAGTRPTAYLYRMVVPANTTSIDVVATYPSNTFSRAIYHAWTSPVSGLNSLVPVSISSIRETSLASVTGSPETVQGGFVIAVATTRNTRGLGTFSGDESYNVRDQQEKSNFSWLVGDAQDVAVNPDSDVAATFNAPDEKALIAASWR